MVSVSVRVRLRVRLRVTCSVMKRSACLIRCMRGPLMVLHENSRSRSCSMGPMVAMSEAQAVNPSDIGLHVGPPQLTPSSAWV